MPCFECRRDRRGKRPIAATFDRTGQRFAVCWHLERRLTDIGGWSFERMEERDDE
jgi:hypothetical protein